MAVEAGYYGLAQVNHAGRGQDELETDHWVLVCGARTWTTWEDVPSVPGARRGTIHRELLVSCSASAPEGRWERAEDFLKHRGGFNLILARPSK
jgi:hypothetical protein